MKSLKVTQIREIYRRYCALENVTIIAADFNVCPQTVYRIGRGAIYASITNHKPLLGRRQTLKLPENLDELYSKNSLEMLALEFECTRYLVREELKRRGVQIRPGRHPVMNRNGILN